MYIAYSIAPLQSMKHESLDMKIHKKPGILYTYMLLTTSGCPSCNEKKFHLALFQLSKKTNAQIVIKIMNIL